MAFPRMVPDRDWAQGLVATFPTSWADRLLSRWKAKHPTARRDANLAHLKTCKAIAKAQRAGVPADANDDELCREAEASARDTARRLDYIDTQARFVLEDRESAQRERLTMLGRFLEAVHWMEARGLLADFLAAARRSIPGALRRLACDRWWRRVLRKMHSQAVESTARAIGLVHKRAGCYVSDDSLKRRTGQRARNARALESVQAINDQHQAYTIAELAAKGTANREIRRHELMTRIAGFELIAKESHHAALFITASCPSRMHAWRTKRDGYGVEPNPKHDGTRPDQAQRHLSDCWARARSAADRAGLEWYGFRIAEPNHDATPHWHALLFFPTKPGRGLFSVSGRRAGLQHWDAQCMTERILKRYFLHAFDGRERGAREHRVAVEVIDWTKGSAAGYVAKYVAKNIDGYKVEKDLYGNDAITSSQRVEAWAATWRIRQFQQIGGAPVGVWRELRRLHPEAESACAAVGHALDAVNAGSKAPDDSSESIKVHTAAHGWASYLHVQGGHRVARSALRVRVLREHTGEIGRYGELVAARAVGVVTLDHRRELVPAFGIVPAQERRRAVLVEVESERANWIIVPKGEAAGVHVPLHMAPARGEAVRPWSPVNNCTRVEKDPASFWFGAPVERVRKVGRWHNWKRPTGRPPTGGDAPATGDPENASMDLRPRHRREP